MSEADETAAGSWGDLLLYLFGGVGLYVAASLLVGMFITEISLGLTAIAILLNVFFLGGSAIVFGVWRKRLSWEGMGLWPPRWKPEYWLFIVMGTLALFPVRIALAAAVQFLFEGGMGSVEARAELIFPGGLSALSFLVALVGVGLLVPLAEELFFRGALQGWLRGRLNRWPTVLLSASIFGLAHFDSPGVVVSAFVMGLLMAWAYDQTRSLWVTIGMHVLTNSIGLTLGALGILLEGLLG